MKCTFVIKEGYSMTQNTKKWIRRLFFAAITVALLIAAVLLMVQCVAIYRMGDKPFTRESVAAHFSPLPSPPCCRLPPTASRTAT